MELVRDLEMQKIVKVRSNIMRENRKLTLPLWPNETNENEMFLFTIQTAKQTHSYIHIILQARYCFTNIHIKEPVIFCLCQSHKGPLFCALFAVSCLVLYLDKTPEMQSN